MNPLPVRLVLAVLVVAGLAAPGAAQEEGAAKPQQAEAKAPPPTRHAVPRQAAPRTVSPPARAAAPERAAERSRGTDDAGRVRTPPPRADRTERAEGARTEPRQRALPRAAAPPPTTITRAPRTESSRERAEATTEPSDDQRRAVPRGSRPRGDNRTTGRAVPRDSRPGPIYVPGGRSYYRNYYYYYPRRWYPYGYGAFGLGYFYYDPYTWYSYDPYWHRPRYYGGVYYGDSGYYTGELRLRVVPRHAEVFVDGYFAGHVDDFDGTFQALRLEEGPYRIEIVAPGYETLVFDVRIQPGRKVTYRGELRPRP